MAVDVALVAFNSSRPILRFRVVFDELGTQILHARGVAGIRWQMLVTSKAAKCAPHEICLVPTNLVHATLSARLVPR